MDVVVVGSVNVDTSIRVERFAQPGETVTGWDLRRDHGGKGANQAVAAARLGAQVGLVARVGDDGAASISHLQQQGVDVRYVAVSEGSPTGAAFIHVDDAGENVITVVPGANGSMAGEAVDASDVWLKTAPVVLAQLEIPLEAVRRASEHCAGLFVLNPAPARPLSAELLDGVDVLVPNAVELATLTGSSTVLDGRAAESAAQLAAHAASQVASLAVPRAVVTLGRRGAVVVDGRSVTQVEPFVVDSVDSTAAGDAFCGALAVALAEGRTLEEAAHWAAAAGALATTRRGAQASLPGRADVARMAGP